MDADFRRQRPGRRSDHTQRLSRRRGLPPRSLAKFCERSSKDNAGICDDAGRKSSALPVRLGHGRLRKRSLRRSCERVARSLRRRDERSEERHRSGQFFLRLRPRRLHARRELGLSRQNINLPDFGKPVLPFDGGGSQGGIGFNSLGDLGRSSRTSRPAPLPTALDPCGRQRRRRRPSVTRSRSSPPATRLAPARAAPECDARRASSARTRSRPPAPLRRALRRSSKGFAYRFRAARASTRAC